MTHSLEVRRQRVLRALARLDREIAVTQQRLAQIQANMARLTQRTAKAA